MDVHSTFTEGFDFDFITLESENFKDLPTEVLPSTIRFYYKKWQKDYFEDTIRRHGESIQSMGKIFSRIRIKSLQRVVARESQWDDVKWRSKAVSREN
jgi:two-component SAPR family response regulator